MAVMLNDIEAILFDWGGTLVQVSRQTFAWVEGAERAARHLFAAGLAPSDSAIQDLLDILHDMQTHAYQSPDHREVELATVLTAWLKKLGAGKPAGDLLVRLEELFWSPWTECLDVLPDVAATLAALQRSGYRMAIVSNVMAPPPYCRRQLDRLELSGYFEATTFSSGVGHRKPDPRIFHAALAAMAQPAAPAPGRTLFVGDIPLYDVAPPQKLGMRTALIRNDQTETHWAPEDYQVQPDMTIQHVRELLDHLPTRGEA